MTESYVNLIPTPLGGTHVNGLRSGLTEAVREFCEFRNLLPRGIKLTPDDVWERVSYILSVKMADPQFSGQTKERLNNQDMQSTVDAAVRPSLEQWLNSNRSTADQIIAELDNLYRRGWRSQVFFVDDNFIGNKKYLMNQLLPALIEWQRDKKGFLFNTEASINLADNEDLMHTMVEAGFDTVFIGIETPDEESLAECNKKQNKNRNLIESVKSIQRTGLQVQGGFIVGFDSDGPSIFQRQIDFIQNSGIVTAMVGMLQAPVGTRLYQRLKREGRLSGEPSGDNVDGCTNVVPCMGLDTLLTGYRELLSSIYLPENYYCRIRTFLREYNVRSIHDLTIHEAMPGHFLQLAHSNRYPAKLRAVLSSGVFIEGWAVYSEWMMVEEGFLDGDPLHPDTEVQRVMLAGEIVWEAQK